MTKPEKKTEGFSFDSLSDVHSTIQDESPAPNEAAIAASAEQAVVIEEVKKGNVDKAGTQFNSELHATNAEGEPSLTPSGKFRKRRGASKVSLTNKAVLEQAQTAEKKASAQAAGRLAADMLVGSAVTLMGKEWIPQGGSVDSAEAIKFDEHANMRRAFGDYFEAKGISDFPPGIALSIALSSYMMPRIVAGPETKTKLAKMKIWMAEKFNGMKKKRSKDNATQPDSGDNGERKDDASEKASTPK